jgi:hypothetical protein
MKIQARKAPREPDTMISLDNRSLLLCIWRRGRQAGGGSSNYAKNHLRGDGSLNPVKDVMVRREWSTRIPKFEVIENRNVWLYRCNRDWI